MTERIVSFLDALVATVGAVDNRYCLVEKREQPNGDTLTDMPYQYVGNGNYRPVEVDGGSVSYWRLVSNISFDTVEGNTAIKNLQATYPLRYVAMLRRDEVNPLTFSEDVSNIINGRNKDLQTQLQARNVNIVVNSVETQTPTIWREEFTVPVQEPNYTRSMVMIDLTVTVIAQRECWQNCDDFPDILQGFDWCGDTVQTVDRLTQEQQDCLSAYLCGSPAPVTEQVNGVTIGTSASGTTNNQLIQDTAGASVGTEANPSVVGDATATVNGVSMATIPAEGTENIEVRQEVGATLVGSQQGQFWRVSDASVTVNSSAFDTVVAEGSIDVPVEYANGTPVGTITGGVVEIPNPTSIQSVTLGVFSDAGHTTPITSADINDTIYLRANSVSGITPVEYLFALIDSDGASTVIYNGVNDNTSWAVSGGAGNGQLFIFATEDASSPESWVGQSKDFELIGFDGLLDVVPNAQHAWSVARKLKFLYSGNAFNVRRASDNASQDIGFNNEEIDIAALESFCSGTDGYITIIYGQDGNGNLNLTQVTSGSQPQIVSSGSAILKNGRPAAKFNGTSNFMETILLSSSILDGNSMALSVFNQPIAANRIGGVFEEYAGSAGHRVVSFADTRTLKRAAIYDPTGSSASSLDMLLQSTQDSPIIRTYTRITNDISVYDNSTLQSVASNSSTFGASTNINIGWQETGAIYHDNTIQEVVIYNTDRSSERTTAETNINDFYTIY